MLESGEKVIPFEPVRVRAEAWPEWIGHPGRRELRRGLAVQRVFDLIAATLCLLVATPIMVLVALAILLEDGRPLFFMQERVGRNRRLFRMVKFRSMHRNADEEFHRRHIELVVNGGVHLRLADDPRITRVGKVIRRWSIDELPNLFNVIRGDMSMVGPRPLVPYEADHIGDTHALRFAVRPGITGLAQINGRLDMTHTQRLDANVEYVRTRTLWTDLVIISKTVPALLMRHG